MHKRQVETLNKAWEERYKELEERFKVSLEAIAARFDNEVKMIAANSEKEIGLARGQERALQRPVIAALEQEVRSLRKLLGEMKDADADIGGLVTKSKEELNLIKAKAYETVQLIENVEDRLKKHDESRDKLNTRISRLGEEVKK